MPSAPVTLYRIDDIEVDPAQRCVRRNGGAETPRARVFDLLLYLIENRGRPVTRKELMDQIWDGAIVTDSVLYKTILEARRALGDEGEDPRYVKTLPKVGYQFVGSVKVDSRGARSPGDEVPAYVIPRLRFWIGVGAVLLVGVAAAAWWRSTRFALPDLPDEEIAWWRFSEGSGSIIRDSIGKAHGRLVASAAGGPPPHWVRGRRGGALSFAGGSLVEGSLRLPELAGFTVSAWVRPEETGRYGGAIVDFPRLALTQFPSGVEFGRPGGAGAVFSAIGKWHHIVGVDEGPITNIGRIFVDGVERAAAVLPDSAAPARTRWRMGNAISRSAPFRGLIDEVVLYARPLRRMEIEATYRCGKEEADLVDSSGKTYYFLPVFDGGFVPEPGGAFANGGRDMGGIQIAQHGGPCNLATLRGADLGQDLRIALDLRVSGDAEGHTVEAGPYFRSRRAYPGDGIAGGTSSGYWLKLSSTGRLDFWQLRPYTVIASAPAPARFEATRFHHLEVLVRKNRAQVFLDGDAVEFEKDNGVVQEVDIQETGPGRGTAGVAFSADANRSMLGGQQVRNLALTRLSR